jgi:hypothetical protein
VIVTLNNARFEPPRHFRDAAGAIVSVRMACERLSGGGLRLRLQMHRLGGPDGTPRGPDLGNRIAEVAATVGALDPRRATCFCEVWIRDGTPIDPGVDLLLRQLVAGVRQHLGQHEILGALVESAGGSYPETAMRYRSYSFRADLGAQVHQALPSATAVGSPAAEPYVPVENPESTPLQDANLRGNG